MTQRERLARCIVWSGVRAQRAMARAWERLRYGRRVIPTAEDITPGPGERLMVDGEILPKGTIGRRR